MHSNRRSILVTGKNGQVGWELRRTLASLGNVVAVDVDDLDFADTDALIETVRQLRPALIVNPAAYTAVDQAEDEPDLAQAVNATAPSVLAVEAKQLGIPIIHYSTDYVFDGTGDRPYTEADPTHPVSIYGKTKLAGETAVCESGARHIVLRLAWVYGMRGSNFLRTMLRLATERDQLRVVDDQIGAPTWSRLIAEATAQIAFTMLSRTDWKDGIYHLPAGGQTSWCGFAREIFQLTQDQRSNRIDVVPIQSAQYPTKATRPAYSVMSGDKLEQAFGVRLPDWRDQLKLALDT